MCFFSLLSSILPLSEMNVTARNYSVFDIVCVLSTLLDFSNVANGTYFIYNRPVNRVYMRHLEYIFSALSRSRSEDI